MALTIKDAETERLAAEVAELAGENETIAVREALRERRARLTLVKGGPGRGREMLAYLEREVWPNLPEGVLGSTITKEEEEEILGFGPDGV